MFFETIQLSNTDESIKLDCYIPDNSSENVQPPRKAMLVIPGGGYHFCSEREAEPIALSYLGKGFAAFVLWYSLKEKAVFPQPIIDASLAMKHIRRNAERYHIDKDKVYAVGFSAGGHLAASLATMWKRQDVIDAAEIEYGENYPNGVVLSYGCVSYRAGLRFIFEHLTGKENPTEDDLKAVSPADTANADSSPMFIWQTSDDPTVPVKNALDMAQHLAELGKQFELHIYPHGTHGIALANELTSVGKDDLIVPEAQSWVDDSVRWINSL